MIDRSNGTNGEINILAKLKSLKPLLKISILLTLGYILIAIFNGKHFTLWLVGIAYSAFIPLFLILLILFFIIERFHKPLKVSEFFLIVIFSVIFYSLGFKGYELVTRTSKGVALFFPLKTGRIKKYFIEKYGMEFKINEITYYLDMGSAAHSGGWNKSISGYLIDDPKDLVKVWISKNGISDNYEKTLFKREVKTYYEEMLKEIIPWDFKLDMVFYGPYKEEYKKSYAEYLNEKNTEIIKKISIYIKASNEIFEKYTKEEYKEVFLESAREIYTKNRHLENVKLRFELLDVSLEKVKELPNENFNSKYNDYPYKIRPYILVIYTEDLNEKFLDINNFKELENYMKKNNNMEVEKWIKN